LGIPVLTTAILNLGRLCLAIILSTISYRRPEYYLSERYHCAVIIIEAIIAIETKSRPKYASTFRNTIQNSERRAKLTAILAVRPVSPLCHFV
jgi:hypothetical protein